MEALENKTDKVPIDEQTQTRLKDYFKNLAPKIKLAIVTMTEIRYLEGLSFQGDIPRKDQIFNQIYNELEADCIKKFHTDSDDVVEVAIGVIDKEDIWLAGVWETCRMVLQNC